MRKKGDLKITGIAFFLVGVVLLCVSVKGFLIFSKPPIDINHCNPSDIKVGAHVKFELQNACDFYCENITETRHYGIKTGEKKDGQEFILPIPSKEEYEGYRMVVLFIGCKSTQKQFIKVNSVITDTMEGMYNGDYRIGMDDDYNVYLNGSMKSGFVIEGKIAKMSSDEKSYFTRTLQDLGLPSNMVSMYIDKGYVVVQSKKSTYICEMAIAGVLVLIGILLFLIDRRNDCKRKQEWAGGIGSAGNIGGNIYNGNSMNGAGNANNSGTLYTGDTNNNTYGSSSYGNNTYGGNTYGGNTNTFGNTSQQENENTNNDIYGGSPINTETVRYGNPYWSPNQNAASNQNAANTNAANTNTINTNTINTNTINTTSTFNNTNTFNTTNTTDTFNTADTFNTTDTFSTADTFSTTDTFSTANTNTTNNLDNAYFNEDSISGNTYGNNSNKDSSVKGLENLYK